MASVVKFMRPTPSPAENERELFKIRADRQKYPELSDYFDKYEKNLKRESKQ